MSNISVYLNTLRQSGYLAYEYNPFHNYQTNVDLYLVNNKFLVPKSKAVNPKNGEILNQGTGGWIDKRGIIINNAIPYSNGTLYAKEGSLIDFDTDQLNFDLEHPVDITVQPSYDGSVNLILNDDKNIPRLINSRFSVREKNTYEIVDRIGENDTNIYNAGTFDKDTSLYFQYEYNPSVFYLGFIRGILPVGQYCFYFTYCDADDNESDYITESGLIPVFIGSDRDPFSIDGGIKNQRTDKGIRLKLTNLDKSYNYIRVYYVRYFADYSQNRVYECKKIYKRYPVNSGTMFLQITGNEETEAMDANLLNIQRFNPQHVLTQAQCKNMLFFGNIVKNTDNYRELTDCALRIIPRIALDSTFETVDNEYKNLNSYGYYNSLNMYNKVGYFDQEYYRFGVVFIYQNGTLSNVYNTLGATLNSTSINYRSGTLLKEQNGVLVKQYVTVDDEGWIDSSQGIFEGGSLKNLNAKGVCKIDAQVSDDNTIIGIEFYIPDEVQKFLKESMGIRGLFFVRQKCVPNILAQCYLMPIDSALEAPVIKYRNGDKDEYITECFITQGTKVTQNFGPLNIPYTVISGDRLLDNVYDKRLYKYQHLEDGENAISANAFAGICPDFLLNQPYYNQIFNGSKFRIQKVSSSNDYLSKENRFYRQQPGTTYTTTNGMSQVSICTVTEDVQTVAIQDKVYRLEMGETEEAFRFRYAEIDNGTYEAGKEEDMGDINEATNLVRGKFSPYLAIYSNAKLETGALYNIYQDHIENITQEFQNRMDSNEPFYSISDRYNFESLENVNGYVKALCFRGDCYINTFTYRLNRNFNDPSLPNNDVIVDKESWKENYDVRDPDDWQDISRADVNAVQLGSWITFKCRSAMNYALRSQDHSFVSEEALMNTPRSYYPRSQVMWRGENKMPDSYLFNDAYRASLGFKCYFTLHDINYIKDTFSNRIQYSAISVQDSFKNNYRVSLSTYFRDYSQEYGGIIKLVGFEGYLLVVFEHAVGMAVVNERILAGNGDGEPVFINTKNVLPEELTIISDTYGSQWSDSIIKSETGYVYGVDTVCKKIWRVKGNELEVISDFKVNKFLVDNISLGERELYPIVGLKNVKTHFNNNKKDIMFTFYDDVYEDEEKVWNLCYNEILDQFVTFYSWVPSYSENIDTQFFTFNRNTSKFLSLLAKCNYNVPENTGILVEYPVISDLNSGIALYYRDTALTKVISTKDNTTYYKTHSYLPGVTFKLEKDHWQNYKLFYITNGNILRANSGAYQAFMNQTVVLLRVTPIFDYNNTELRKVLSDTAIASLQKTETIALTLESIVNNQALTPEQKLLPNLTTDFYLHGQSGIFNVVEDLYPTHWYGEFHPFEFEFIVNDNIQQQKIFNNLVMISNKVEPESFHFEIEGDNYDFSEDKRTMYYRQEATKKLFQENGSDILYNRNYTDVRALNYTQEQYYRAKNSTYTSQPRDKVYPIPQSNLVQQVKSTIFPLYYDRIDTYNDIYHHYHEMNENNSYDFKNLSGSEIIWDRDLNQFNIVTHIKNSPVDIYGRLRGNSQYKEGRWLVQIPAINYEQSNEATWTEPPIVLNTNRVPSDVNKESINNILNKNNQYVQNNSKWTLRKQTRIRDKWMKIRVRYSGKNLAVIHSLITLYNISYS